jgi:phenylacetate-CoA ligase
MVSGGEVLFPDLLRRAEEVFGARILERYGAHEVGQIAWRCLHCGSMHTNDDSVVVEIARDGTAAAPGERGEILVTGLLSFAMPFLRFPLEDVVAQGLPRNGTACPFGFGSIGAIEGRRLDNLVLADGRSIPTYGLMGAVRLAAGVRRFEIVQESFLELRIRFVRDHEAGFDPGAELVRRVREALPVPMSVRAEEVTEINPQESGKYRFVRSLVGRSIS